MAVSSKINHPLHIVLSLLTGGFWLFVYLYLLLTEANSGAVAASSQRVLEMERERVRTYDRLAQSIREMPASRHEEMRLLMGANARFLRTYPDVAQLLYPSA